MVRIDIPLKHSAIVPSTNISMFIQCWNVQLNYGQGEAFFKQYLAYLRGIGFADAGDCLELFNYLDVNVKISNYFILRVYVF